MKTAISLPDPLFRTAEKAARELRVSRSQLYALALSQFLERQSSRKVTETLNAIYGEIPANVHGKLHRALVKSLPDEKW